MRPSLIDYIKARFHYELDTAHEEHARAIARMEDGEFERGFVAGLERGLRIVTGSPALWEQSGSDSDSDSDTGSDPDTDSEGGDSGDGTGGGGSGSGDSGGGSESGGDGSGDAGETGGVMTQ